MALDPGGHASGFAKGKGVHVDPEGADEVGCATVLVALAAVYSMEPLGDTSPGVLVSVVVEEAAAAPIAGAAAQDRVRLVLAGAAP